MANPWMGYQQQYMAYNPYYMYGLNYPGIYGGQAAVGQNPTHTGTENAYQNQSTNQSTDTNINNATGSTNQNSASNTTESTVRQRTVTSQQGPQTPPPHVPMANAAVQQHSSNAGMASLIVIWLVAVSIIALVLRRIFIE